jgi:hypothetical protein
VQQDASHSPKDMMICLVLIGYYINIDMMTGYGGKQEMYKHFDKKIPQQVATLEISREAKIKMLENYIRKQTEIGDAS